MKKYKLIKEYPGSLELGSIIQSDDREFVEGYPEFWEEIKPKDYIITEFKSNESGKIAKLVFIGESDYDDVYKYSDYGHLGFSDLINDDRSSIHSVKRISDNVIFTVGDKIKCINSHVDKPESITEIKLNKEGVPCLFTKSFRTNGLNIMKSVKIGPILITEDGVPIFEEDTYYAAYDGSYEFPGWRWSIFKWEPTIVRKYKFSPNAKGIHRFSTRELAEKYVENNKPKPLLITDDGYEVYDNDAFYSVLRECVADWVKLRKSTPVFILDDGVEIFKGDAVWNVNKFFDINKGRICDPDIRFGYKHFSTEAAALNYVNLNKPIYSLTDILEMQQRNNIQMLNLLNKK